MSCEPLTCCSIGGGHRLRYHVRIGAGEAGRHRDLRRNHLRVLGNRKAHRRQRAHQDHRRSAMTVEKTGRSMKKLSTVRPWMI